MNNLPKEIERKFLIRKPEREFLASLPESDITEIFQTYLLPEDDYFGSRRVRKRGKNHEWQFTYTRKHKIAYGERIELEEEIPEEQYILLLQEADPDRETICKYRCCVPFKGQKLEIDVYAFSEEYATLEIELTNIQQEVNIPEWLEVIREVTDEAGYSNFALSFSQAFPEERENYGGE